MKRRIADHPDESRGIDEAGGPSMAANDAVANRSAEVKIEIVLGSSISRAFLPSILLHCRTICDFAATETSAKYERNSSIFREGATFEKRAGNLRLGHTES